jgi:hypothetical protein
MEMMKNSITNFPDPAGSKPLPKVGLLCKPGLIVARKPKKSPLNPQVIGH